MAIGKGAINLAMIIAGSVVLISIVVVSYLAEESIGDTLQSIGVFAAGILTALGIRRGTTAALVALLLVGSSACGAAPPWQTARMTVDSADMVMDFVPDMIPEDAPRRAEVLRLTDDAIELGDRAVDIWEDSAAEDPPPMWRKAAAILCRAGAFVVDILKTCGVDLPPQVAVVLSAMQMLAAGA